MAGTSSKGEPGLNAYSAAQDLHTEEPHIDDIFKAFEALEDHCNLLDQKISALSSQLDTLEHSLKKEREQRELLETELHVSQAITMATYDARSQFLDNMSHEMRTPLNGILGMAQLVLDSPLTPDQRESIEAIQQSGQALDDIISGLLDYSRLKQGEFPFEQNSFELASLLENVISDFEARALEKNLELALIPKATTRSRIETDRARLNQIIEVLLDNALKFTSTGYVALFAELNRGPKNKGRLNLRVQDTGMGIKEEHLPFIFEPFWQAELSNTRKFGGLGMGLALCQELVIKMGGHIEVIESSASGTIIEVSLPVNILGKAPELSELDIKKLHKESLRVGFYNVNEIEQVTLRELLGWHQIESVDMTSMDISSADNSTIDVLISPASSKKGNSPEELLKRFEAGDKKPIFIGLTIPNQSISIRDRQQFDIFLSTPIFHTSLHEALSFAIESLQHREASPPRVNEDDTTVKGNDALKTSADGIAKIQEKVLLVEPVKLNQKILSHMLQSLNYEVVVLESPDKLKDLAPDLVFNKTLINVMLDPEEYVKVLHKLRSSTHWPPDHRIIGVQATGSPAPAAAYVEAGVEKCLNMPTGLDSLKKLLEEDA